MRNTPLNAPLLFQISAAGNPARIASSYYTKRIHRHTVHRHSTRQCICCQMLKGRGNQLDTYRIIHSNKDQSRSAYLNTGHKPGSRDLDEQHRLLNQPSFRSINSYIFSLILTLSFSALFSHSLVFALLLSVIPIHAHNIHPKKN